MPVDRIEETIAWQSDNPHLSGNFAPVGREIDASALEVIEGRIPEELSGAYIRNGPNPRSATGHWFTGDGMIHGV